MQVLLGDLDGVVLGSVAAPLIGHLLGHQLFEDEEQQLVVVPAERQVTGERLKTNRRVSFTWAESDPPDGREAPTFLMLLITLNFCVSMKLSSITLMAMFTSSSRT